MLLRLLPCLMPARETRVLLQGVCSAVSFIDFLKWGKLLTRQKKQVFTSTRICFQHFCLHIAKRLSEEEAVQYRTPVFREPSLSRGE